MSLSKEIIQITTASRPNEEQADSPPITRTMEVLEPAAAAAAAATPTTMTTTTNNDNSTTLGIMARMEKQLEELQHDNHNDGMILQKECEEEEVKQDSTGTTATTRTTTTRRETFDTATVTAAANVAIASNNETALKCKRGGPRKSQNYNNNHNNSNNNKKNTKGNDNDNDNNINGNDSNSNDDTNNNYLSQSMIVAKLERIERLMESLQNNNANDANANDFKGSKKVARKRERPPKSKDDGLENAGANINNNNNNNNTATAVGKKKIKANNNEKNNDAKNNKINNSNNTKNEKKQKKSRINWGKSPHRQHLTSALQTWFQKTTDHPILHPITQTPILNYKEYCSLPHVDIPFATFYKYIRKDLKKRRLVGNGSHGKKRLIGVEGLKEIVEELRGRYACGNDGDGDGIDDNGDNDGINGGGNGFSRVEAMEILMVKYGLTRVAARKYLTRDIIPLLLKDGWRVGEEVGQENDDGGNDGGKPTIATDKDGGQRLLYPLPRCPKRCIVISGITSGLGRALLGFYYNQNHDVAGCGRRVEDIEELKSTFPRARLSVVDVSNNDAVAAWAKELCTDERDSGDGDGENDNSNEVSNSDDGGSDRRRGMQIDLVIANAGISPETSHGNKAAWEVPCSDFDDTIDINIKGVGNMIRHFIPLMIQNCNNDDCSENDGNTTINSQANNSRHQGAFVAMSSGLGRSPNPYHTAYCASKWAIEGMIKSLAMSLPEPLCAVPLAPGIVETGMQKIGNDTFGATGNVDKWVTVAGPMILDLDRNDNGKSLSVGGFYTKQYKQSWIIKDGTGKFA